MNIIIINKHYRRNLPNKFYIGRGSPLGNRYTHLSDIPNTIQVDSIDEAVECFDDDLMKDIKNRKRTVCDYLNQIYTVALEWDIYLECYCMDEIQPSKRDHNCHATVVRRVILDKYNQRGR